jgi:HD-GYP domain-containing protein (c-di-GMP phosphodiesterase class II)
MADRTHVRLAELVAALSLGIDLGFGQPMEHVLRQCLIALRLADRQALPEQERVAVYYTALLMNVGCHTDAYEQAKWFGDDIALKAAKYDGGTLGMLRLLGSGRTPLDRLRTGLEFAVSGRREVGDMITHHAEMARALAEQLGLPGEAAEALGSVYEQWDGKGFPGRLSGEAIPRAARLAQFAENVEVAHRTGGAAAARALARRRQFDPALAGLIEDDGVLADLDVATWDAVIDAEPALARVLSGDDVETALVAVADFVDLKTPCSLGHARAVAELATAAGDRLGLPEADVRTLRRAALVHDLGRLGVSNAVWDKPGPLGPGEWERVRLQPYLTERMLSQSASLGPLGAIAVQHRERLDGSGYPRGLPGAEISLPARILGAADAYQAMCEPRPHRPALALAAAADELRAEVRAGRLDGDAVEAVLGRRAPRRREGPEGLTAREIEVLRLVARGLSNRQIAEQLVISPKTVGNHVEHIYAKIGASTRAAASLFAVRHGLLPD